MGILLLFVPGCLAGGVYSHTTRPLDVNFRETAVHDGAAPHSWKTLVIPAPGRPRFDWGSTAIADAAREAGIDTVHYADLETLSVLGVWTQRWIHVYGE